MHNFPLSGLNKNDQTQQGGQNMEPPDKWPVASLSPQNLQKVQQLESQLHAEGGKDIILIAYQNK
jgi:hypothetical protein